MTGSVSGMFFSGAGLLGELSLDSAGKKVSQWPWALRARPPGLLTKDFLLTASSLLVWEK